MVFVLKDINIQFIKSDQKQFFNKKLRFIDVH